MELSGTLWLNSMKSSSPDPRPTYSRKRPFDRYSVASFSVDRLRKILNESYIIVVVVIASFP
jgi:hypothetical protein